MWLENLVRRGPGPQGLEGPRPREKPRYLADLSPVQVLRQRLPVHRFPARIQVLSLRFGKSGVVENQVCPRTLWLELVADNGILAVFPSLDAPCLDYSYGGYELDDSAVDRSAVREEGSAGLVAYLGGCSGEGRVRARLRKGLVDAGGTRREIDLVMNWGHLVLRCPRVCSGRLEIVNLMVYYWNIKRRPQRSQAALLQVPSPKKSSTGYSPRWRTRLAADCCRVS